MSKTRARKIKLLLFDVDGVMTDGKLWFFPNLPLAESAKGGVPAAALGMIEAKGFHAHDGTAISLARLGGLKTGLITKRNSETVALRARDLKLEYVCQGVMVKAPVFEEILEKEGSGERLEVKAAESLAEYLRNETKLRVEYDKGTVSILLERPHDALIALSHIEQSGIEWKTLRTREDTLEDIFVRMVGGSTKEAGEVV